MKTRLAVFYMEIVWLHMGTLRGVPFFHRLFNLAYGARMQEYKNQIILITGGR